MMRTSLRNNILLTINIFSIIAIFLALIGSVVSPLKFLLPIFFSLGFPLIVIVNIAFVIFWLILRKRYFLISLLALLFSLQQLYTTYPIHWGKSAVDKDSNALVIVSYNTHMNSAIQKNLPNSPNEVVQYLLSTNADIICIQEYYVSEDPNKLTQADMDSLFKNYPYKCIKFNSEDYVGLTGLAIFSKFPIIRSERIYYESIFNASIYSDIKVGNDTIRVFNNHLESNRFTGNDLYLAKQLRHDFDSDNLINTSMFFSQKLSKAYRIRASQADSVAKVIKSTPYKLIVCGDFNDVPISYSYTTIKGDLNNAFVDSGTGFGFTLNKSVLKLRIDHIFYDDNFEAQDFQIGKTDASDHFPLKCILKIK